MDALLERARAYLAGLEAERQSALALSEQKAEEAKLIKARQEGFQAALELLGHTFAGTSASAKPTEPLADCRGRNELSDQVSEPRQRRGRRPIRELIVRELSFSGQPMTAAQIAKAIRGTLARPNLVSGSGSAWSKTARFFGVKRVAGQSASRGCLNEWTRQREERKTPNACLAGRASLCPIPSKSHPCTGQKNVNGHMHRLIDQPVDNAVHRSRRMPELAALPCV